MADEQSEGVQHGRTDQQNQRAVNFLKRIVRIPSINPPGNERGVAIELAAILREHGVETELVEVSDGRSNLVAWLRGTAADQLADSGTTQGPRRVLGFSGHMDVVPPGQDWKHPPFAAVEENGRLYGRGTSDMKGGLAALVMAMIELQEAGVHLQGDIKLLASVGEEVAALGAKHFVQSGYLDDVTAIVIAEPSCGDIVIAHKGALWVEIEVTGRSAHGSTPHLGVNAIVQMNKILTQLLSNFQMEWTADEILGDPTMNIAVIQGGVKTNMVPDACKVELDFRTVPSQTHAQILRKLQELLDGIKDTDPNFRAVMKVLNDLPPIRTPVTDDFVRLVQASTAMVYGVTKSVRGMSGYTDGAAFAGAGTDAPIVIIGGGDDRLAHQTDEYIEIRQFLQSIELYKEIAKRYLG
ncbi:MAG: M20 family metallopeptidase [Alicyclobacillus sp.]|nr:M20 family metallopeptidase [Alicyclobacillus sp.]